MISIRRPTASFRARESAPVFNLVRPINGLRVGIRTDHGWHSWLQITEIWSAMLKDDGAEPVVLQVGDHVGREEEVQTTQQLEAWANAVDCAVVGLAN